MYLEFWKILHKDNIISNLLASSEWEYQDCQELIFLIEKHKKFEEIYFKYYKHCRAFREDISDGFKKVYNLSVERAKYKICSKTSLEDVLDFINDDSELIRKSKNRKKIKSKKKTGKLDDEYGEHFEFGFKIINSSESCTCCICMDSPINCILIPCGHKATCTSCANNIFERNKICPLCKREISLIYKNFS